MAIELQTKGYIRMDGLRLLTAGGIQSLSWNRIEKQTSITPHFN